MCENEGKGRQRRGGWADLHSRTGHIGISKVLGDQSDKPVDQEYTSTRPAGGSGTSPSTLHTTGDGFRPSRATGTSQTEDQKVSVEIRGIRSLLPPELYR